MWAKRCAYEQKKLSRDKKGLSESFKKIEKLKYERDERCAHGQKKLSTGDKALAVSKSFSGIKKYMLCGWMDIFHDCTALKYSFLILCKMMICVREIAIPILNYLNYLRPFHMQIEDLE